jgi:hypothetical protein
MPTFGHAQAVIEDEVCLPGNGPRVTLRNPDPNFGGVEYDGRDVSSC